MRKRLVAGVIAVVVIATGAVGGTVYGGGVARRGCEALRSWWLWGPDPPPPLADNGRVRVKLPDGSEDGGTLSGTICYRNGHRGCDKARDLPARYVAVYCGGITVAIEDARWWRPAEDGEFLRPDAPSLVASISCCPPAAPNLDLAREIYRFGRGRPVELDLDFEITILPPDETDAMGFVAKLGDLEASGRQAWSTRMSEWSPILIGPNAASVSVVMVHGAQNVDYADTSLRWNGEPLEVEDCVEDRGTWRIGPEGTHVVARSLISGSLAP